MTECCEQCKFWNRFSLQPANARSVIGECLRHSPRVFQGVDDRFHTKFPVTPVERWCGDFRPKVEGGSEKVETAKAGETTALPGQL